MQQINFLNCDLAKLKAEINLNGAWNDPNIAPSIQNRIYKMGKFLGLHGDEKLYYSTLDGIVYGFMETENPNTYKWEKIDEVPAGSEPELAPEGWDPEKNLPIAEDVEDALIYYVEDESHNMTYYLAVNDKVVNCTYLLTDYGIDIEEVATSIDCFDNESIILTNLIAEETYSDPFESQADADADIKADLNDRYDSAPNNTVIKVTYTVNNELYTVYYKHDNADGWVEGVGSDFKAYVPEIGEYFCNSKPTTTTTYTWTPYLEEPAGTPEIIELGDCESSTEINDKIDDWMDAHQPTNEDQIIGFHATIQGAEQPISYIISIVQTDGTKFYQYGTYSLSAIFEQNGWEPSIMIKIAPTGLVETKVVPTEKYPNATLLGTYPSPETTGISFDQWMDNIKRTRDWERQDAKIGDYYDYVVGSRHTYYMVSVDCPIRPTDTVYEDIYVSNELFEKYGEEAIVNIDGKEYTISVLGEPGRDTWEPITKEFYMNRDHRISIKWAGDDIIETFTIIAIR